MAAGGISLAQAGVIGGRVATLPRDPELRERSAEALLALVRDHAYDATDLDRCFPGVVKALDTDGLLVGTDLSKDRQERGAHHARFLSLSPRHPRRGPDQGLRHRGGSRAGQDLPAPLAAPVVTEPGACGGDPSPTGYRDQHGRLIGPGCPQPRCLHDGRDPRDAGVRMWDALVTACRRLQATDQLPHAHATTARITITIGIEDLRDRLDAHGLDAPGLDAPGLLPSGDRCPRPRSAGSPATPRSSPPSSAATVRSSTSAAPNAWSPPASGPPSCSATSTAPSPAAPGSPSPATPTTSSTGPTEEPTSLDNLILLCRKHHTITHQTPWQVDLDPHTRRPVWTPPPLVDDRDRFTYRPASRPPPMVA